MSISYDQKVKILERVILGVDPPENETPEEKVQREKYEVDKADADKNGWMLDFPLDWEK